MAQIQAIRGMNDILPGESAQWESFENIVRQWTADYGYQNIRTPIVEQTGLFVRSIGEATDIVEKEMYSFVDSLNGENLTLRPEGTASCLRAVLEHGLLHKTTQKLWYSGPMFRHEKPQKGRYRQFHQIGLEALNFSGPDADAELILMTADLWQRLGLSDCVQLQVNTLGNKTERGEHRQALIAYLEKHQDVLDEDGRRRLHTNPLRVLDSKNPAMQTVCDNAPRLIEYLGTDSLTHYRQWLGMIKALGIDYVENPRLVRGLDYYNLSVFEWVTNALGAQGTVCAGGRYDGLIEELGGKPAPAVGFAMGIERLLLLIQEHGVLPMVKGPDVYLVQQGEGAPLAALQLAKTLRSGGYSVLQHCGDASFKSQMKKADASGARFAVIIGENEMAQALAVVKPLRGGEQQTVAQQEIVNVLAALIANEE